MARVRLAAAHMRALTHTTEKEKESLSLSSLFPRSCCAGPEIKTWALSLLSRACVRACVRAREDVDDAEEEEEKDFGPRFFLARSLTSFRSLHNRLQDQKHGQQQTIRGLGIFGG